MPTSPENAVKKLSRLPPNCVCANCGTHSKYGFSTVCIKYLTFVCNACKSSHQAISHRCKSLTMSAWDQGEVLRLKSHGNDHARRVWLATAPAPGTGGRPREGDDINVFKRFVSEAYDRKRYYRAPDGDCRAPAGAGVGGGGAGAGARAPSTAAPPPVRAPPKQQARRPPEQRRRAAKPQPPPAVDLLDFGAFEAVAPVSHPPAATVVPTAPTTASNDTAAADTVASQSEDPFFDPFRDNGPANDKCHSQSGNYGNDAVLFPAPSTSSMGASTLSTPSFDPFGGSSSNILPGVNTMSNGSSTGPPNNSGNGMMMMNGNHLANGNSMNGSMMNQSRGNSMMMSSMNGSMMNQSPGNSMMMNGGTVMNGSLPMNGTGGMVNISSSYNNTNATMMMNNGDMVYGQPNTMMNVNALNGNMGNNVSHNGHMMNMMMTNGNTNGNNSFMASSASTPQPQHPTQTPPPAMNINVMQPPNNTISHNFGAGFGAGSSSAQLSASGRRAGGGAGVSAAAKPNKPDPFAGLGF